MSLRRTPIQNLGPRVIRIKSERLPTGSENHPGLKVDFEVIYFRMVLT